MKHPVMVRFVMKEGKEGNAKECAEKIDEYVEEIYKKFQVCQIKIDVEIE
jgi:hypothetical protein